MLRIYVTPPPTITSEDGDINSPPSDGDTPGAPPRAAAPPGRFFQELLDPRLFGQFAPPPSAPPGKFLASIGVNLPPAPAAPLARPPAEQEGDGLARNAAAGLSEGVYGTLGFPVDAATWLVNRGIDGVNAVTGADIANLEDLPLGSRSIGTNLEHYAGIPDPAKVRAVTLAEKAARAAGEGASYAIAPQALLRADAVAAGVVGAVMPAGEAAAGSRGFRGERLHPESGLLHPYARPDDPAIGRALSPDARSAGANASNPGRGNTRLAGGPENDKDHDGTPDDLERLRTLAPPTSPNAGIQIVGGARPAASPAAGFAGAAGAAARSGGRTGRLPGAAGSSATQRPEGIPEGWVTKPSRKNDGTVYINPGNDHDRVRVMPGNPNSQWPTQQVPYAKREKDGIFYDNNGNPVSSGDSPEAHIPLDEFRFREIK